jgi:hypothetical protein
MMRLLVGLLALVAATPAWAAKPDAATVIPKLLAARAACAQTAQTSEIEAANCTLAVDQAVWDAQDLDAGMKQALAGYRREVLDAAQAADAKTISADVLVRRRTQAERALRQAMFGNGVRFTNPGLDPSKTPTREDLVQVFPAKASAEKKDGQAMMSCRVMRDGVLSACWIVSEVPPGYGFGQAAIALSKLLKGTPATLNGQPIDGAEIRFALGFDPAWL